MEDLEPHVGFTRGKSTPYELGTGSVAEIAHQRLDQILGWVADGAGGGDFIITQLDTGKSYRITFCDFTAQQKCRSCGGTGTEGSNFPVDPPEVSQN